MPCQRAAVIFNCPFVPAGGGVAEIGDIDLIDGNVGALVWGSVNVVIDIDGPGCFVVAIKGDVLCFVAFVNAPASPLKMKAVSKIDLF